MCRQGINAGAGGAGEPLGQQSTLPLRYWTRRGRTWIL